MSIPGQSLRGLVGQGMDGRRRAPRPRLYRISSVASAGAFSISADYEGYAEVYLWGAGGAGLGNGGTGAGSGAAVFRRVPVLKGQSVAGAIGAGGTGGAGNGTAGADSTIIFPDGLTARAGGGLPGTGVGVGAGGIPTITGDAVGRVGSPGGSDAGVAGVDGGGAGGTGGGGAGGGGGAPGFASIIAGLSYGTGGTVSLPGTLGGGGGSNPSGVAQHGAAGRLLIYWIRVD